MIGHDFTTHCVSMLMEFGVVEFIVGLSCGRYPLLSASQTHSRGNRHRGACADPIYEAELWPICFAGYAAPRRCVAVANPEGAQVERLSFFHAKRWVNEVFGGRGVCKGAVSRDHQVDNVLSGCKEYPSPGGATRRDGGECGSRAWRRMVDEANSVSFLHWTPILGS